jgi:Family of unknown function (DUF5706)
VNYPNGESLTTDQLTPPSLTWNFIEHEHGYLTTSVLLADQKAGFLLALACAALAFLNGASSIPSNAGNNPPHGVLAALTLAFGVAALGGATLCSLLALWPRGRSPKCDGRVYWRDVAGRTSDEFTALICSSTDRLLLEGLLQHAWELAMICDKKYRWIGRSTICMISGIVSVLNSALLTCL